MSLLDRLRADSSRADRSSDGRPRSAAAARLESMREHAVRSHEPTGWLGAALHGMWAALLSWLVVLIPVQVAWVAASRTRATWGDSVRVATDGWVLLHGVALRVPGGELHLLPMGLALIPAGVCWWAGRRLGEVVPRTEAATVRTALRSLALPVASLGVGYAVVLVSASQLAAGAGVHPVWWQAAVIGTAGPALVAGTSALRAAHRVGAGSVAGRRQGPLARQVADLLRVPRRVRRAVRPALTAVCLLVVVASVTVAAALVVGHGQVLAVQRALHPGVVGGALLTLGQIGLVPNLVVWAVAWLAGPGFSVGVGTLVSPAGSTTGLLPLVPVLGAVPPPGPLPSLLQGTLIVPVVIGAVTGVLCARAAGAQAAAHPSADSGSAVGPAGSDGHPDRPGLSVVLDALVAAMLACLVVTVLAALSAGSAGPGLLSVVGPSVWHVGLVLLGELAVGACVGAWFTRRRF